MNRPEMFRPLDKLLTAGLVCRIVHAAVILLVLVLQMPIKMLMNSLYEATHMFTVPVVTVLFAALALAGQIVWTNILRRRMQHVQNAQSSSIGVVIYTLLFALAQWIAQLLQSALMPWYFSTLDSYESVGSVIASNAIITNAMSVGVLPSLAASTLLLFAAGGLWYYWHLVANSAQPPTM